MLSTFFLTAMTLPILALNSGNFSWGNRTLASHQISLNDRYNNSYVNDVFKDNILLTLAYMDGSVKDKSQINWDKIRQPVTFQFQIQPGKTFAFHDGISPEYKNQVAITSATHFNFADGFLSDGYLTGDGVCHLASLMNWTAKDAGLASLAPTRHDFANIPEISKENGVAIYYGPGQESSNARENLYITNNLDKPVTFKFEYTSDSELKFSILEN